MVVPAPMQVATGIDPALILEKLKQAHWTLPAPQAFSWHRMQVILRPDYAGTQDLILAHVPPELEVNRVRAVALYPCGELPLHRDNIPATLHIVLMTNPQVTFEIEGFPPLHMPEGTAWLIPSCIPHTARNEGDTPRIHMVAELKAR